ncbi:MAG: hypothetical protein ABSG04_03430 [Verrucomicrobiota bacterium]
MLNNGVAKIGELSSSEEIRTLRFELESFVCDGEYERGLQRILHSFLAQLSQTEQKAAWISGFFGSGKSHLAKMLCYLWVDYKFQSDGATARSLAHLPSEIRDLFVELGTQGNRFGGLCAVAGTLGSGSMDNTRLALLQLVFRSVGLPEHYALARIVLWLREKGWERKVIAALKAQGKSFEQEITNPFGSTALAQAILAQDSSLGQPKDVLAILRQQFPVNANVTIADVVATVREVFSKGGEMPLTLIVLDEVQQFIGQTNVQRAMDVQEIVEKFCSAFKGRLLLVGTGQQALTDTSILQRLIARFPISVSLSDADVENVVRKVVLAKRADKLGDLRQCLAKNQGEIDRHLKGTRLGPTSEDHNWQEADYPLVPVRRRLWEKVLRAVDTTGTAAQLRNQLTTVFEAARATATKPLGNIVGADFIFDQLSAQMRNTGALLPEFDTIIRRHRDGSPDGLLRSRLPARPDTKHLRDLALLSGNAQLIALLGEQTRLKSDMENWQRAAADIAKRRPRWDTLQRLLQFAKGLPVQVAAEKYPNGFGFIRTAKIGRFSHLPNPGLAWMSHTTLRPWRLCDRHCRSLRDCGKGCRMN